MVCGFPSSTTWKSPLVSAGTSAPRPSFTLKYRLTIPTSIFRVSIGSWSVVVGCCWGCWSGDEGGAAGCCDHAGANKTAASRSEANRETAERVIETTCALNVYNEETCGSQHQIYTVCGGLRVLQPQARRPRCHGMESSVSCGPWRWWQYL